jgi:hypothetical protein
MTSRTPTVVFPEAASLGIVVAIGLACLMAAQAAAAACPAGYRQKGEQCIPGPADTHPRAYTAHSNVPSSVTTTPALKKPSAINKEVDRTKVKPQPGTPIELNPQPIPPGHAVTGIPHPGAPIQKVGH